MEENGCFTKDKIVHLPLELYVGILRHTFLTGLAWQLRHPQNSQTVQTSGHQPHPSLGTETNMVSEAMAY